MLDSIDRGVCIVCGGDSSCDCNQLDKRLLKQGIESRTPTIETDVDFGDMKKRLAGFKDNVEEVYKHAVNDLGKVSMAGISDDEKTSKANAITKKALEDIATEIAKTGAVICLDEDFDEAVAESLCAWFNFHTYESGMKHVVVPESNALARTNDSWYYDDKLSDSRRDDATEEVLRGRGE